MPTYEYRCPRCGHQFEAMHAVSGTPPKCERCGRAVRRVFTPVGIIFKGSGWHITDYRKTPAPVEGDAKTSAAKKSDAASSDKAAGNGGKTSGAAGGAAADGGATSRNGTKSGGVGSKSASRSGGGGTAS